ncbi:MAG: hypothetical protein B6U68_01935 [Candidatus Aenigmarchaeota archaeon ex4484_14]|nr:MAG: hypothetical protein B6U68_01935 [Candidatus Aenigmarchaeota archaeon ex4484_14]
MVKIVIGLDHRNKPFDGDLLLTVACPVECDFCIYSCTASKEPEKWMPEHTIRRVAEEYSKNGVGVRISGGEPFYDLEKLESCLDILLEYYHPRDLLIISSGFWGHKKEDARRCLSLIKNKGLDLIVISYDRFHARRIPITNIKNIIETAKDVGIEMALRLSLDSESYDLIDKVAELITKHRLPIEVHRWGMFGRAEKLNGEVLKDYNKTYNYISKKIKENAKKCGAPEDLRYYLTHTAKRSQRKQYSEFFPTTFPNGNVYGCSMTMKGCFMGNINRENLDTMMGRWKKTLPGHFALSEKNCSEIVNFLPKGGERCDFCKNWPFIDFREKRIAKEALGRLFVKIKMDEDLNTLIDRMKQNEREYLLSFRLTESDLNPNTGRKIEKLLQKLKENNIRFLISRPFPKCLRINKDYGQPTGCLDCHELFSVEDGKIVYCDDSLGPDIKSVENRQKIVDIFIRRNKKIPDSCIFCIHNIRETCNFLCNRKFEEGEKPKTPTLKTKLEVIRGHATAWDKVLEENIVFKKSMKKSLLTDKIIKYISENQTREGYIKQMSPMINYTYLFSAILHEINERPSPNTIKFLSRCQAGFMGFGEEPGEMPWIDWTEYGVEALKWVELKIKDEQNLIKVYKNLQKNGGFQQITSFMPDILTTFKIVKILSILNSEPADRNGAIEYIKNNTNLDNLYQIYRYIESMKFLRYKFKNKELQELSNRLSKFRTDGMNYESLFYLLYSLKSIGKNIIEYRIDEEKIENLISNNNPRELLFLLKILNLFSIPIKNKDKIIEYCKNHELKNGGFVFDNENYIFKQNAAIHTLYLLDRTDAIDKIKYINYLNSAASSNGWGAVPNQETDRDLYTTSSLIIHKILFNNRYLDNKLKLKIVSKLNNRIKMLLNNKVWGTYYYARSVKEILESFMLLSIDINKDTLERLINKMFSFLNHDGGFGNDKISFVYTTYLSVYAIWLAEKYMNYKYNENPRWIEKIKNKTSDWLKACQNNDGGFGASPKQFSNIQATAYAIFSLYLIGNDLEEPEKTTEWIKQRQNDNGGFAQERGFESDLLLTFYSLSTLIILDLFRKG